MSEHYTDFWEKGIYKCSKCGNPLFKSDSKFKSRTIWPSFRKAMPKAIKTKPDYSHGMIRTELLCAKCDQHLGHVFDDGKIAGDTHPKAENRFCVVSECLNFEKKQKGKAK